LQALARQIVADDALAEQLADRPAAGALLREAGIAGVVGSTPRSAAAAPSVCEPAPEEENDLWASNVPDPTAWQIRTYCMQNTVPFIGFGFFDNAIMILAGDLIDSKLGIAFGITTMAAAAIGNTISDVIGLWVSGLIETFAAASGLPDHGLTNAQRRKLKIRIYKNSSMVVGLTIGCTLGMFPLVYPKEWRFWPSRDEVEMVVREL